jgi:hypothetical protein
MTYLVGFSIKTEKMRYFRNKIINKPMKASSASNSSNLWKKVTNNLNINHESSGSPRYMEVARI